jgi:geranylgeranyl diphosphate synthase type II
MKTEVQAFFDRIRPFIDTTLDDLLPPASASPPHIHRAMRYSIFAGGKRLRPALCVAGYSIHHADYSAILPVAAAIEMVHTYSLIHDDLPAMDDDDFRRGKPSCHKEFGEAAAILAGDALLTLAFETVTQCSGFRAGRQLQAAAALARALGTRDGMIAGQMLDLEAEGRSLDQAELEAIHAAKTGALLSTSVWIGAYLGGASDAEAALLRAFGRQIGLAFQIMDDVLDETESGETLGKTAGKDRQRRKATYPAVFGLDESRRMIRSLTREACALVEPLGATAAILIEIAHFLETRCR